MSEDSPAGYPTDAPPMTLWQARLLDLRTYICCLFAIFGVTVTIEGLFTDSAELQKAAGVNINLYAGISMLVLSAVMGVWAIAVPPEVPQPAADADQLPNIE